MKVTLCLGIRVEKVARPDFFSRLLVTKYHKIIMNTKETKEQIRLNKDASEGRDEDIIAERDFP